MTPFSHLAWLKQARFRAPGLDDQPGRLSAIRRRFAMNEAVSSTPGSTGAHYRASAGRPGRGPDGVSIQPVHRGFARQPSPAAAGLLRSGKDDDVVFAVVAAGALNVSNPELGIEAVQDVVAVRLAPHPPVESSLGPAEGGHPILSDPSGRRVALGNNSVIDA